MFVYLWRSGRASFSKALGLTAALGACMVLVELLVRAWVPGVANHAWPASLAHLLENLQRPRAVLSFLLSLGAPGLAAL